MAEKLAYTIAEVAKLTGISRSSLYRQMKDGSLVARKRGSSTLILASDLKAFLNELPSLYVKTGSDE